MDKLAGEAAVAITLQHVHNAYSEINHYDRNIAIKAHAKGDDVASGAGSEFRISKYGVNDAGFMNIG